MTDKKLVKFEFINKRNELKKVEFYMDKQTYEILHDESISEVERKKYLIDEYHEYERERYHNRKTILLDENEMSLYDELLDEELSSEEKCIKEEMIKEFFLFMKILNDKQKELIKLIYFEGKTQNEVAKKFGVSKAAINQSLTRIYKKIKKYMENN